MKMPRKTNGKNSSLIYSLQKAYAKIATYRPSRSLIAAVVMGISIFLLGGGIYDLFLEPLAVLPMSGGRFLPYIPGRLNEQLLMGSLGVMILYLLGSVGLILTYRSTRYAHNRRHAFLFMGIGIVLFLVSFLTVELIVYWIRHY